MTQVLLEILILLVGSFALGMFVGYVLKGPEFIEIPSNFVNNNETKSQTGHEVQQKKDTHNADAISVVSQINYVDPNNLKIVEGIGPKIQELLNSHNIKTLSDLAGSDEETLRTILVGAGERYRIHDPSTWSERTFVIAAVSVVLPWSM